MELADALHARGRSLVFITGELGAPDFRIVTRIAQGFAPAFIVSVVVHPSGAVHRAARDGRDRLLELGRVRHPLVVDEMSATFTSREPGTDQGPAATSLLRRRGSR